MVPHDGDPHVHDDDADGCVCDIEFEPGELTDDADLPPSSGAVLSAHIVSDDEVEDACAFTVIEATDDADLPAAVGGVS